MESGSNNEKLKNEEKKNEINYKPLSVDVLRDLLKNSKGIETLWKKIKDNKDGKKSILYKYENDLVKLVDDFTKALAQTVEDAKKTNNPIDLGKNLASKDSYRLMVTTLLTGAGEADAFIKKFPHWTIQVGSLFTNSVHYKRIATKISGSDIKEEDIDSTSNFDVAKKIGGKKTGKESKKGFFKSISSFFSKYIKRGGMGKASKSKVTIELAKFGKYVNEPWRRWWETVADSNTELSKKKAKEFLKSALKDQTGDLKAKLVCLFNTGTVEDNKGLEGPYVKLELDKKSGARVVGDSKEGAVNKMYQIFKAIDAKLGNKAEALFNGAESAKNLDTNDDKIKRLIELHKIFYTDKKAIKFSEVFERLVIDTKAKPDTKAVAAKVDELFNGSTFSNNENAKKDVKKLAEDARKFLRAYSESDKSKRLLYELRFLGSCFKFNDLNNIESVDQAINVLNRLPKNAKQVIQDNDPVIAKKIDEEIAKSAENIKSLNDALKNLDKADFNKPENQQTLLNALGAIEKNKLLQLGTSEKFEDLTLKGFCDKLASVNESKYAEIANLIVKMDIFKTLENEKIGKSMEKLKKSLIEAEAKKNGEKKKQSEQNIHEIEKLFNPIKSEEANYNGNKRKISDPDKGKQIITAIKKMIDYQGSKRTEFLKAVAKHIGIEDEGVVDKIAHTDLSVLKKFGVEKSIPYLLLRKIRNLIAYGIGVKWYKKSTGESMPEDVQ